jgi:hypothetical protein
MPTNTGEAREIKNRADANESEVIRKSKTLARKVKAELKKNKGHLQLSRIQGQNAKDEDLKHNGMGDPLPVGVLHPARHGFAP